MKLKLRIDKNTIQAFLTENVEKVVFGGFVLCFLLIVYGAVRRDSFEQLPRDLVDRAGSAEKHWQLTSPEDKAVVETDYPSIAHHSQTPTKEEAYSFSVRWNSLLFEQTNVRRKPELYAVEELRGFADRGPLSSDAKPAAGVAGPPNKGRRWVVLTGLAPKRRQGEAFKQALGDALNSATQADLLPVYRSFLVERADVTGRGAADEPDFRPLETVVKEKAGEARSTSPDTVPQELRDPVLTASLSPLAGKSWNSNTISHEHLTGPSLAEVSENPDKHQGKRTTWQGEVNNPDGATRVVFRVGAANDPNAKPAFFAVDYATPEAAQAARGGAITGTVTGTKVEVKVTVQDGSSNPPTRMETVPLLSFEGQRASGPGGEGIKSPLSGVGASRGGLPANPDSARGAGPAGSKVELPEYVLFRFFDFNVEPGKQYRYRVRLLLSNPNYRLAARLLESPELAVGETLETLLSNASEVVSVPRDVHLLASSVTPPQGWQTLGVPPLRIGDILNNKPSGKILLVKWEEKNGLEAFKEFPCKEFPVMIRGTALDFPNCTFPEDETSTKKPAGKTAKKKSAEEGEEEPLPAAHEATARTDAFNVDYITGALILDLNGGTPIAPGKDRLLTSPGAILVLDADGSLRVHRELDDLAEYRRIKPLAVNGAARPKRTGTTSAKGTAAEEPE